MDPLSWRKSARSSGNGENCVELAGAPGIIAVRDSKDPDGPKLILSRHVFREFVAEVKST